MADNKSSRKMAAYKRMRQIQKKAARYNESLERTEQEETNRIIDSRIEARKSIRKDMAVKDIIKSGTPEEKAAMIIKDYDERMTNTKGLISLVERDAIYHSFGISEEEQMEKIIFLNYLKLYQDIADYTTKIDPVCKRYQIQIALLSKLIDKYEAIGRDMLFYDLLYGSCVKSKGHSGMSYNITDNDKSKMKSLDDTTPEALLAEINEAHKDDGVVFRVQDPNEKPIKGITYDGGVTIEDQGDTLVADIFYEGGLYDQIKEQAETCKTELGYVKSYIEPIFDYLNKNDYWAFVPFSYIAILNLISEEKFSKDIIASRYHLRDLNDRLRGGGIITEEEKKMAVVPDYNNVEMDEEVLTSCIDYIKSKRNEPAKIR